MLEFRVQARRILGNLLSRKRSSTVVPVAQAGLTWQEKTGSRSCLFLDCLTTQVSSCPGVPRNHRQAGCTSILSGTSSANSGVSVTRCNDAS